MADEDGLLRLGDGEALAALQSVPPSEKKARRIASHTNKKSAWKRLFAYLAGVNAAILSLCEHVALAGDMQALGKRLVDGGLVAGHDVCKVLHLLGADLPIVIL